MWQKYDIAMHIDKRIVCIIDVPYGLVSTPILSVHDRNGICKKNKSGKGIITGKCIIIGKRPNPDDLTLLPATKKLLINPGYTLTLI